MTSGEEDKVKRKAVFPKSIFIRLSTKSLQLELWPLASVRTGWSILARIRGHRGLVFESIETPTSIWFSACLSVINDSYTRRTQQCHAAFLLLLATESAAWKLIRFFMLTLWGSCVFFTWPLWCPMYIRGWKFGTEWLFGCSTQTFVLLDNCTKWVFESIH
jgi:hypothetical protein